MSTTLTALQDRTVGQLAVEMPDSIRVFEAWKIDYCCGGKTPIEQACTAAGKTMDEFEAALASLAVAPKVEDWNAQTLVAIADRIVCSFHAVTREELETFRPLAAKVLSVHGERRPELNDVVTLIGALTSDMLPHMLKEEQVLFPYVGQLEGAAAGNGTAPTPFFGTVKNPVRMMMLEHDRVGELLQTLRTVTDDFTPPESACFSYRELYRRLAAFEKLTHEHIHVENNLYFPRAVELEERAGTPNNYGHGCQH
jgi:regulator of cell morphogenesis and NO signaling